MKSIIIILTSVGFASCITESKPTRQKVVINLTSIKVITNDNLQDTALYLTKFKFKSNDSLYLIRQSNGL